MKLDDAAERLSTAAAKISGLETQLRGEQDTAKRLTAQVDEAKRVDGAKSDELTARQRRISQLEAELGSLAMVKVIS